MATLPVSTTVVTPVTTVTRSEEELAREKELKEIERLRSKNPDYDAQITHWNFMLASYEGGPEYVTTETLFKHQREHPADYDERMKRAHYQNYCQPLVDFVPEFIFSQEVEREPGPEVDVAFKRFKNNVDRCGTTINNFMKGVSQDARIFGKVFIQVDKPRLPDGVSAPVSVADAEKLGVETPYFVPIRPVEVYDWAHNERGILVYIKRVQHIVQEVEDFVYSPFEVYHEWNQKKYLITYVDVSDPNDPTIARTETAPNSWGVVPFIEHYHRRAKSNTDRGVAFLNDISKQNGHVFNLTSLIDEFLYRQCFNILAVEAETQLPMQNQMEGHLGTNNVLEFPREAKHLPAYISPASDPAEFIQQERENTIREMYRTAAQDIASEMSGESGDAISKGFARTIPVIADQADQLAQTETSLWSLWAKMMRKTWTGKIAYRDDYSITNLMDLLLQLTSIFNNIRILSPSFVRAEWKRIIREFDGKLDTDTMEKIISEINGVSDDDIVDLLKNQGKFAKTAPGASSAAQLMQGKEQTALKTDRRRSLAKGDRSSTKERVADRNKRTKQK